MNIISLIEKLSNDFNEKFNESIDFFEIEEKIRNIGDDFTLSLYQKYIEYIDTKFMCSPERKEKYVVKEILHKSWLTKIGLVTFNYRIYIDKETKERYSFIRDVLNMRPYQRISDEAEYEIIKYAEGDNMSNAAKHAIRNTILSRSTVQKKCKNYNGSVNLVVNRTENTPQVLYIEMDEVHTNLQDKLQNRNHVCPCAVVHEGHKEEFVKRKELKNVKNFATTDSYHDLWNIAYDYCDRKYDLDKVEYIFISGDGAPGIKGFTDVFPNGIYVFDPFHYKHKGLDVIFKKNKKLKDLADKYLRADMIEDFKALVQAQIELYPDQEKRLLEAQNYLINNIEGIKNQQHEMYKCPCSMEGRVSNYYAKYLTSRPNAFSIDGLKNRLKLLVLNADKYQLSFADFINLKYGEDEAEILKQRDAALDIKFDISLIRDSKRQKEIDISVSVPRLDDIKAQYHLEDLIRERNF